MTIATSNRYSLRMIPEVTLGTTPVTPAFQTVRTTGESINAKVTTVESAEIRSDRQTADLILTDVENGGDINFELSAQTYDTHLEALLMGTWGADVGVTAATHISATATTIVSSGATDWVTAGVLVGDWIKVSGFATPANNGYHYITGVTSTVLTVDTTKSTPAIEADGPAVTVVGSTLRNGVTERSFTIEKELADATVPEFFYFRGMRFASMSLNMSVGEILKGSFTMLGSTSESTTTRITGATTVAATTTSVMDAVNSVATIVASAGTSTLRFNSLSLTYDNKHRQLKALGVLGSVDSRAGTISATGSFTPYFEDSGAYAEFLANTSFDIYFTVEDSLEQGYLFHFKKVKFTEGTVAAGGKDEDIVLNAGFQLILDPVSSTTLSITRV